MKQRTLNFCEVAICGEHQHAFSGGATCDCGAMVTSAYVQELLERFPVWVLPAMWPKPDLAQVPRSSSR